MQKMISIKVLCADTCIVVNDGTERGEIIKERRALRGFSVPI